MNIYQDLMSILRAPDVCPCNTCYGFLSDGPYSMPFVRNTKDMFGLPILTGIQLLHGLQAAINGPSFPDYVDNGSRILSLMSVFNEDGLVENISKAGFFYSGNTNNGFTCFYCGLCLCEELLMYNPWTEHARWCPVCPHIKSEKSDESDDFIHSVIEETRTLKQYYKGKDRPEKMETSIIIDALSMYPQVIIMESIHSFFIEVGSFPSRDELFHILDNRKSWKTFDDVPL